MICFKCCNNLDQLCSEVQVQRNIKWKYSSRVQAHQIWVQFSSRFHHWRKTIFPPIIWVFQNCKKRINLNNSSKCCCNVHNVLNQNVPHRYGVPGGPDGRPGPCPVSSWRGSGGHHHLLVVPRGSESFWMKTLLASGTPEDCWWREKAGLWDL